MPVRMLHYRLPVLGYRVGKMAYLTDFSKIDDAECAKLQGLEVLVMDALRQTPHHAHLMLSQALDLVNKLKPKRAYFMHICHDMGLHEEVQKTLPENVFLAYDGLTVEI
jgi:phosphoribosyl 1,2-cyclic phosphate phosphodiesterase